MWSHHGEKHMTTLALYCSQFSPVMQQISIIIRQHGVIVQKGFIYLKKPDNGYGIVIYKVAIGSLTAA